MLKLLKDAECETEMREEGIQRRSNLARLEKLKQLENKDSYDRSLICGENVRRDLKRATQASIDKHCKQNICLCEESLGRELKEMKLNEERERRLRQYLWKTAPELQSLQKMFLTADVARDQAMQLAEKEALRKLKRQESEYNAEMIAREKAAMEAEAKQRELEEARARHRYHQELDQLCRYKKSQESCGDTDVQQERAIIDEIKKQIEEEDLNHAMAKIKKQKELHQQMVDLQKQRQHLRLQEKLRDKTESQKVDEFRNAQELRAKELEEKKQLEVEQKLQVQEELLCELEKICQKKLQMEQLRTELAIEEKEVQDNERSLMEEAKKKKIRDNLQKVYDMQMCVKKQKEDLERKEEEIFRQKMLDQLYEQDKLDLMGQNKRRLKQLQHKKAVEEMLKERQQMKEEKTTKEQADQNYQAHLEAEKRKLVEEERIRFLKEHAGELLGYLPKGTIKDQYTIERLGGDVKDFYSNRCCKC